MNVEIDDLAKYMGELCGAAKHAYDTADPSDVGLHGIPIKLWRDAYYEGCTDMVHGLINRLPKEIQQEIGAIVTAAFDAEIANHRQEAAQSAE